MTQSAAMQGCNPSYALFRGRGPIRRGREARRGSLAAGRISDPGASWSGPSAVLGNLMDGFSPPWESEQPYDISRIFHGAQGWP